MRRRAAPVICSIGSVDPTGAAGLTTDLQVYTCLRGVGVAVVGGVTAQNSRRVVAVAAIAPALVKQQLECIWEQRAPDAVCVGLLPSAAVIKAVDRFLGGLSARPPVVIDPVISASSGRRLLDSRGAHELVRLFRLATIVTPNAMEAEVLTGSRVATLAQAESAARMLSRHGCSVLVTGGHLKTKACVDVLASGLRVRRYTSSRLTGNMRGSGGILAAAIAANLARGLTVESAVSDARRFVHRAHRTAQRLGSGKPQFIVV